MLGPWCRVGVWYKNLDFPMLAPTAGGRTRTCAGVREIASVVGSASAKALRGLRTHKSQVQVRSVVCCSCGYCRIGFAQHAYQYHYRIHGDYKVVNDILLVSRDHTNSINQLVQSTTNSQ